MSRLKRVARIAAGALLVTGIFAGSVAPAGAASDHSGGSTRVQPLDTGWGG